ncbi:hypothetical protein N665_0077s0039 [Sinapis alba]|nr:hypothetical protein N665_0077s0039 [Sinapis alba]
MSPLDLLPLPLSERISTYGKKKAKNIRKLHEKVRATIKAKRKVFKRKANKKRTKVVFEEGDLVWVHLRKERFPEERKSKLMPRIDGPFQILRNISDNVYQLDLQGKYDISSSFNVSDLSPFLADDPDLWTNPFEKEGNDVPQYMDQYMEPDQNGDQDVQHSSTEVLPSARTNQTDHAVYRINPCTSEMELRPEPRLDERTDRTIDVLLRPTRQAKTNGRARITLERENPIQTVATLFCPFGPYRMQGLSSYQMILPAFGPVQFEKIFHPTVWTVPRAYWSLLLVKHQDSSNLDKSSQRV